MYYDGANWKWEDEMDKILEEARYRVMNFRDRYIEWAEAKENDANVKAINALLDATNPEQPEKKEQRKLVDVMNDWGYRTSGGHEYYLPKQWNELSKLSIDAVIECYEEFDSVIRDVTFPEYLKEKLGNEGVK